MAAHGIGPILIANQVVGRLKITRLMALAQTADVTVAVDGSDNVAELSAAALAVAVRLPVLVEVDVGVVACRRASRHWLSAAKSGVPGACAWPD
jgi:D-serine deaminase-like pyridoxal phosphate-dependent protein